ncbi:glutamyl-tRNA reductase [Hymenobacter qilianensis]|uniref:Glutamyl-tRNA reductase n=1 Tax=Hymenobacter qilianensis TaxID=1385715 RepID=A0ACB5PQH2_9BACT|nr:glutamyl-tRNA reductase [Hymenobacter qilianensis]GGF61729.1 glutamyl-tRNA reductase [Hymenobacter qilianensis]
MKQSFKAVSLSYKKAPLAIRELLTLDEATCCRLLHTLHHHLGLSDVLVLSTCNRTEIYYTADTDNSAAIVEALGDLKEMDASSYSSYFTVLNSATAAVQHLFEVALGLDAQVVGDMQISSQVKRAYQRSTEANVAGPFLHRLLHTVFAANKRVQQETAFRDGAASTSYATLELVQELTANIPQPRVLIVGLGEIGADICRHFGKSKRFAEVTICNRTPAAAQALATECGLQVLDFAHLTQGLQAADVVISAIATPSPFFTRELLDSLTILSPKFFIDLSVPRSIAAAAEQVPGVLVYNIDAIQNKASEALARRVAAVSHVREIIAESMADLHEWSRNLQVSPVIQKLKTTLEQLRQQELNRFGKNMSPAEVSRLDDATKALTQKFLKLPVVQLKAACQRGEADQLVAMLTELFALEDELVEAGA